MGIVDEEDKLGGDTGRGGQFWREGGKLHVHFYEMGVKSIGLALVGLDLVHGWYSILYL